MKKLSRERGAGVSTKTAGTGGGEVPKPRKFRELYEEMPTTARKNVEDRVRESLREMPVVHTPRFRSAAEEAAWWDNNAVPLAEEAIARLKSRNPKDARMKHKFKGR
jgi:hypothetical protein